MEKKNIIKNLGFMLDCSRDAVMSVSQLKLLMQRLNKMGYNQFYLYIEDTYEIDSEPYFGYLRGRYSQEELSEIENIALSFGMEFIPCIQTLGHLNALMQWPCFRKICDDGNCLLAGDEGTYELIEKMLISLRKCLKTKKIHLGLDETYYMGKGKYRELHGDVEPIEIYLSHLERVCKIADKYEFEPMVWGDMFHRAVNKDKEAFDKASAPVFKEEWRKRIPKNLTLYHGDYNWHSEGYEYRYADLINWERTVAYDNRVVLIGAIWKWGSFSPRNQMSIDTIRNGIKACEMTGTDAYLLTSWGDDGAEASTYSMLPAIVETACLAQGITEKDKIKEKFKEWLDADYDAFMLLDKLDDTPEYPSGLVINKSKYELYNDCFLSKLDSMVAPYDAADYAEYAKQIGEAKVRSGEFKYVFDMYEKLASVLSVKADIGIRSRDAYNSKDKKALDALITDYKEMISRTEAFYEAFRTQWYTENKPHGFEVHDIRIGGLIMRMKNCCRRLEDYSDGRIDKIIELEDKIIPYRENLGYPRTDIEIENLVERDRVDNWPQMITTNVLYY